MVLDVLVHMFCCLCLGLLVGRVGGSSGTFAIVRASTSHRQIGSTTHNRMEDGSRRRIFPLSFSMTCFPVVLV